MDQIYPTPPAAKLEKIRRKWYKKTYDSFFDVDFDPNNPNASTNPAPAPG